MKNIRLLTCLILSVMLFSSCESKYELPGKYKSIDLNYVQRVYYRYIKSESYFSGTSLTLKADSSFLKTTCGNYIVGYWSVKQDTLLLYCTDNKFKNDSINKIRKPSCGTEPMKLVIEEDRFRWERKDSDPGNLDLTLVELLVKED